MNFKIALGGLGSAFLLGSIFWAGAAYNRLQAIENHMVSIDSKIGDYSALVERVSNDQAEIKALKDQMRDLQFRLLSRGQ